MSDLSRRGFIGAAAAAASLASLKTSEAAMGDPSFQSNVPDELLARAELPTLKLPIRGTGDYPAVSNTDSGVPDSEYADRSGPGA
jgi:hypothetical protein